MNIRLIIGTSLLAALLPVVLLLPGCVQMPTEKTYISDLRPQISFKLNGSDPALLTARVLVNGLDSGVVGSYLDGQSALRVLSGTNSIRVVSGSNVVFDQRVYIGDGVSRVLNLN